jgi:hypothetical protein
MYRSERAWSKMLSPQAILSLSSGGGLGSLDSFADIPPPGEVPSIRKVFALLGFDGLNRTLVPLEEKTSPILPVDQGQSSPVGAEAGVILNKDIFLHPEMSGDRTNFVFCHPHKAGPTAAGRAALAEIVGWHDRKIELWIMNYEELNLSFCS